MSRSKAFRREEAEKLPSSWRPPAPTDASHEASTSQAPLQADRPVLPSALKSQLEDGRNASKLKPLRKVVLPGKPGTNNSLRRAPGDTAHDFADVVRATRHEAAELRADLAQRQAAVVSGSSPPDDPRTSARDSMNEWAQRTHHVVSSHPDPAKAAEYSEGVAYSLYREWRAPTTATPKEQRNTARQTLSTLGNLSAPQQERRSGVDVTIESSLIPAREARARFPPVPPEGGEQAKSAYDMQYYMRHASHNPNTPIAGRLTVNFPASAAPQYITNLHDAVAHNPGTIDSAKVPTPSSLGHAIDDAVVYLGEAATAKDAKRVAEQIVGSLPREPVPAAPPGMEPLIGGASYSEHRAGTSTSHGAARASVVADAVKRKLAGSKKSMPKLMGDALKAQGYDPKQPSRLARPGLVEKLTKKLIK